MRWQYLLPLAAGLGLLGYGLTREVGPEGIALEYGRALYAGDAAGMYRFLSTTDRKVKDEATFLQERGQPTGFALELVRRFASFIEASPVKKTSVGERVTVTLKLRLPDANAPEIATLVHGWDERRLDALSQAEQRQIMKTLDGLHQSRKLSPLEGEETFQLVREGSRWRVFLDWAGGVRVRFGATVDETIPLQVTVIPEEVLVNRGDRVMVTLRATNLSTRAIVTRVAHRIEPKTEAVSLALLQCPLLLPITLAPGQTEELRSEYMVLKDVHKETKRFQVTYEFASAR